MMKTAAGCWIPKPRNDPLKCVCLHNYCAKPHTLWRNRNDAATPHVLDNSVFALSSFYRYRMLRFCACFIPKQQRQLKNAWKRRQNGNPIRGYQRREARWGGGGGGGAAVSICQSHHAWASQTALPALLFFLARLAMPCLPSTAAPFVVGGALQSRVLNALTNFSIHRAFMLQHLWNLASSVFLAVPFLRTHARGTYLRSENAHVCRHICV